MIKKALWLLSVILFLSSCNPSDEEPFSVPDKDSVTILAYLIANNNLNEALLFNIAIMYDGLKEMDEPASLLVYWDGVTSMGENNSTHLILQYNTDGKGNINGRPALAIDNPTRDILNEAIVLKEYPSQISTDKEVFKSVLSDLVAFAPTDKLGLVIGSHGSSWLNTIATDGRALGYDGSTSNSIELTDMVEAIQAVGKKFEFLLFDECYMGTAEVCYECRNLADYIIASVMEVPAYGFPYDFFLSDLYEGTVSGYKKVCQSFIDYYQSEYDREKEGCWGTIALIDCSEVNNLVAQFREEIVYHKDALSNYNASKLQEYGRNVGKYIAYDLQHFIKDLNGGEVPEAFEAQLNKTVLDKGCLEKGRCYGRDYDVDADNFCGLGLYIPLYTRSKWNSYFKTLDWYTASGWNEVSFSWNF